MLLLGIWFVYILALDHDPLFDSRREDEVGWMSDNINEKRKMISIEIKVYLDKADNRSIFICFTLMYKNAFVFLNTLYFAKWSAIIASACTSSPQDQSSSLLCNSWLTPSLTAQRRPSNIFQSHFQLIY